MSFNNLEQAEQHIAEMLRLELEDKQRDMKRIAELEHQLYESMGGKFWEKLRLAEAERDQMRELVKAQEKLLSAYRATALNPEPRRARP